MPGYRQSALALAALMSSVPAMAGGDKAMRAAEIVHMDKLAVTEARTRDGRMTEPAEVAFRLLDLARDRVGEVKRDGFGVITDTGTLTGANPRNTRAAEAMIAPSSDIAVPGWMQSPLLYAPPVAGNAFKPGCSATAYRPSDFLPLHVEARRRAAYDAMRAAACEADIPVGLFDALILSESSYNASAISPKRAYGLAQLMPSTAAGLGVDRYDPVQNLRGGARYLRAQLDSFGNVRLALAAYNAGPGRVKGGRIPLIAETQNYVRNVLDKWARLAGHHQIVAVGAFDGPPAVSTTHAKPMRAASIQIF